MIEKFNVCKNMFVFLQCSNLLFKYILDLFSNKHTRLVITGFRSRHFLTGGSFTDPPKNAYLQIKNVKAENISTTLLIIGFHNYRENYIKTGQ